MFSVNILFPFVLSDDAEAQNTCPLQPMCTHCWCLMCHHNKAILWLHIEPSVRYFFYLCQNIKGQAVSKEPCFPTLMFTSRWNVCEWFWLKPTCFVELPFFLFNRQPVGTGSFCSILNQVIDTSKEGSALSCSCRLSALQFKFSSSCCWS